MFFRKPYRHRDEPRSNPLEIVAHIWRRKETRETLVASLYRETHTSVPDSLDDRCPAAAFGSRAARCPAARATSCKATAFPRSGRELPDSRNVLFLSFGTLFSFHHTRHSLSLSLSLSRLVYFVLSRVSSRASSLGSSFASSLAASKDRRRERPISRPANHSESIEGSDSPSVARAVTIDDRSRPYLCDVQDVAIATLAASSPICIKPSPKIRPPKICISGDFRRWHRPSAPGRSSPFRAYCAGAENFSRLGVPLKLGVSPSSRPPSLARVLLFLFLLPVRPF